MDICRYTLDRIAFDGVLLRDYIGRSGSTSLSEDCISLDYFIFNIYSNFNRNDANYFYIHNVPPCPKSKLICNKPFIKIVYCTLNPSKNNSIWYRNFISFICSNIKNILYGIFAHN